jgi:hypothetical protein
VQSCLNTVFRVIIEYYQGVGKGELCELVEKNELAKAHYRLTQRNQLVAVGCKKPLFISPHINAGRNGNIHWAKELATKIMWWRNPPIDELHNIMANTASINDTLTKLGGGTYTAAQKYTMNAAGQGTYLHEAKGRLFLRHACLDTRAATLMTQVVPGRLFNPCCGILGCTPDGITCADEKAFEDYYQTLCETYPQWGSPPPPNIQEMIDSTSGIPIYIHELKTIQKHFMTPQACLELKQLHNDHVVTIVGECDPVVRFLTDFFVSAGWLHKKRTTKHGPPAKK